MDDGYVSSPFLGFFFDMCVFASSFIRFYLMTSGYIGVPLVTLWSSNWIQFTCSGLTFDNFPLYCNMQHEDDQIVSTWSMIVWNCHSLVNQWMYPVQHLITSTQKATKGPRWSNCQLISLILHFIISVYVVRCCGGMILIIIVIIIIIIIKIIVYWWLFDLQHDSPETESNVNFWK